MSDQVLPLCSIQQVANRDGYTGPNARIWVPFVGYVFSDGRLIGVDNVRADLAQNTALNMQGLIKPNVYAKDCCACS